MTIRDPRANYRDTMTAADYYGAVIDFSEEDLASIRRELDNTYQIVNHYHDHGLELTHFDQLLEPENPPEPAIDPRAE
jgi:hypothetical protein